MQLTHERVSILDLWPHCSIPAHDDPPPFGKLAEFRLQNVQRCARWMRKSRKAWTRATVFISSG
jgi:hypothetical protein